MSSLVTRSNGETTFIGTADVVGHGKKSSSICTFNCCTVLLLAIITVLMQLLLIMNLRTGPTISESKTNYISLAASKRNNGIVGDQQLQVASDPEEEDSNYRQRQRQQTYYFDKVSTKIDVDNLLSLGQLLLRQGDAIGALASCTSVFTVGLLPPEEGTRDADRRPPHLHDKDVLTQAYTCAGEASLKLYQNLRSILHHDPQFSSSSSSSSTSPSSSTVAHRIEQAKFYFELAMDLDPRNPRVRAGLALSLFLIATTATPTANDPSNNSNTRKSLLLLEAIQHFTTAATYYDHSIRKDATFDDATTTSTLQRSCWYNAALCFIHLQHYSDAIPLLQKTLLSSNTYPNKDSDDSFTTNTKEIISVIKEIEGLKYELETQSRKLEQLLQRTTPSSSNALPTSGEKDDLSSIDGDDIATVHESDRDLIPALNQGGIDEIDNNIRLVASDTNMDFSLKSHSKIVHQLPIENATNETIFATKIDPSSFLEEDRSIELERADDISTLNTSQNVELLVTSDVDLSTNKVIVIHNVTSHNDTEMQQPALSSDKPVLKTDATKNVSKISPLQSMNESELLLVIPDGVNRQASADTEGTSIVGIDPDFIINAEMESLPSYDNDVASNIVAHGDMTASSSTENKTNVISAAVEDDYISIGNASKTEERSIEDDMTTMNMSFEAVTLMPSSHGEVPMDTVIDSDVNLITTSDEIEVLLIPEVGADANTASDDDSAANALGTKAEVVEISNENILKRDQLNESMSLLPPTQSHNDLDPQNTIELKTKEDKNTNLPTSGIAGAKDVKSDGEDPLLEVSAEPRQQQLFSYPTTIGNASVNLDVDLLPPAVRDDLASDIVSTDTNNATAKPDDKAEYILALEGEIEIPVLFSATPRLSEEVNLTPLEESHMKVADSLLSKSNFLRASKQLQKVIKSSPNYLPARLGYANALESLAGDKKKNIKEITLAYVEAAKVALKQDPRMDYVSSAAGDGGLAEAFLNHALMFAKSVPKKDRLEIYNSLISAAHTGSFAADAYYHLGVELLSISSESSSMNVDYRPAIHALRTANQYASLITGNEGKGHGKSLVQLAKIGLLASQDKMQVQMILQRALTCSLDEATKSEALLLLDQTKSAIDGIVSESVQGENKMSERSDIFSQSAREKDTTIAKLKSGLKAPGIGGMWSRGLEKPADNA